MDFLSSNEGRRLFDLLLAQPASKTARAVLADWLLERGDPLGEFISLQLKKPGSKREARLRMDYEATWLGPIHEIADGQSITFEGGFLSAFRIEAPGEVDKAFVQSLRTATGHPALSLVRTLELGRNVGHGGLYNDAGAIMNPPREKGRKIPIVGFIADPVFDRLEQVTFYDGFDDLGPAARAALKKLRPKLVG